MRDEVWVVGYEMWGMGCEIWGLGFEFGMCEMKVEIVSDVECGLC